MVQYLSQLAQNNVPNFQKTESSDMLTNDPVGQLFYSCASWHFAGNRLPGRVVSFSRKEVPIMPRLAPLEQRRRNEMFVQGMLWCNDCKQFFPVKDFRKDRSVGRTQVNYGYRKYCIQCDKAQHLRRREEVSIKYKERNAELKAKFVELSGGACHRCGYNTFNSALDFHHIYRAEKKSNPTHIIYSGNSEKAWKELDKCCLLCRNCHSGYEAGLWRAEFIKRDGLGWTVGEPLPLDDSRYETEKPPKYQQASMPIFNYEQKASQLTLFESRPAYVGVVL